MIAYIPFLYHIDTWQKYLLLNCSIIWLEYIKTLIFAEYLNHIDSKYNVYISL